MINHYGPGPYGSPMSEPDEMEALNSDVMRFMAILGICLMVIFALVQSLPQSSRQKTEVTKPVHTPVINESHKLKEENKALRDERDAMYKELDKFQQLLTNQKQQIDEIEEQKRGQQVQNAKMNPEKRIKQQPEPETIIAEQAAVSNEKEGFTLRFQSTGALDYLIRQGEVQLLVQVGEQILALQARGSSLVFNSAASALSFHEMEAHTVPVRYKRLLAGSGVSISQDQQRIWGVVLPSTIRSQINQVIQGHIGGELQIDRKGQVSYHESRSFM